MVRRAKPDNTDYTDLILSTLRGCKDFDKQIDILVQLTGWDEERIVNIAIDSHLVPLPDEEERRWKKAIALIQQGYTKNEVSRLTGLSRLKVDEWRKYAKKFGVPVAPGHVLPGLKYERKVTKSEHK